MRYLLDTNICIEVIRKQDKSLIGKFIAMNLEQMAVSAITVAELQFGVSKSSQIERNAIALTKFLTPIAVLDFDGKAASSYGKIRAGLQKQGTSIGPLDSLIAAHALAYDMTLVTNNMREFKRVEGLKLENWVEMDT